MASPGKYAECEAHLRLVLDDFVHGYVGPWSKAQLARVRYQPDASTVRESRKLRHPL
jgi:hypothetical protein